MSTKEMLKSHLEKKGAFKDTTNVNVTRALQTISGEVPYRLKLSIALSELITFTSQLRKHIILHDGTLVPCNAIVFALSGSGTAKDSSMNMVRKALKPGYEILEEIRKEEAKSKAEKMALLDGKPKGAWLDYYEKPKDLQAGLGSVEGITKHFHALESGSVGAGSLNASEIGSELLSNRDMPDIIKTLAIGYDLGKIPAKIIKSSENQTDSIDCLPMSALFFGSESAILYDNGIKAKFKTIFTTQLARRSIFSFTPEEISPPEFTSIEELSTYRKDERERTLYAQQMMKNTVIEIIENTDQDPLVLTEEAQELFDVYKEYNQLEAMSMKAQYPINKLARKHKQWLALKLSGNFAILDGNEVVTAENYIAALNTIESFSADLMNFEKELVKEPYEIFCEFCKHNAEEGKYNIGLHALRKLGYIPMTGSAKSKVEELVHLASSYDQNALYTSCAEGICYEEQVKTAVTGISFLEVSGTKEERADKCHSGYQFYETEFEELGGMLSGDYAYALFNFKDGIRGKENIIGGAKILAFDIDDSSITDQECHLLLEGINHHIARTSDPDNEYKFRILIELDAVVDISDLQWKYFIQEIGKHLGLNIDVLPKSQIYFAYEDREVLSELDGDPLETREFVLQSNQIMNDKPKVTSYSNNQQKGMLADPLTTFDFAFNANNGEGSRSMIRAALYAKDLNADEEYILDLMDKISHYWTDPMDESRLENTIKVQIRRWF